MSAIESPTAAVEDAVPTITDADSSADEAKTARKRKRSSAAEEDELEIDVNLPEPPSKKAQRKLKKASTKTKDTPKTTSSADGTTTTTDPSAPDAASKASKRSDYGIWIGNLPFTTTSTALREFLTSTAQIPSASITRLHMPAAPGSTAARPQVKGFAYVDFDSAEGVFSALQVSETFLGGRKVLIKDAKSFVGRPEEHLSKKAGEGVTSTERRLVESNGVAPASAMKGSGRDAGKERSKRVFVGNLAFETTKEDLLELFAQAGQVEDVHMATFEDSGKCKGFAWVRFEDEDAAENAVKGFVFKENDEEGESEQDDEVEDGDDVQITTGDEDAAADGKKSKKVKKPKKKRRQKWFINRLYGRTMRCEFAEDAKTRYNKRYGKGSGGGRRPQQNGEAEPASTGGFENGITEVDAEPRRQRMKGDKDQRQEQRRKKHMDARLTAPGAALSNAPRASAAIVQSKGQKISFEE